MLHTGLHCSPCSHDSHPRQGARRPHHTAAPPGRQIHPMLSTTPSPTTPSTASVQAAAPRAGRWQVRARSQLGAGQQGAPWDARLMFITPEDAATSEANMAATVRTARAAVAGGCCTIQVRVPAADSSARARLGAGLLAALSDTCARVIIGDGDVRGACECGAHGIHLPGRCAQTAGAVRDARRALSRAHAARTASPTNAAVTDAAALAADAAVGADASTAVLVDSLKVHTGTDVLVGVSAHSASEACDAAAQGADYVLLGSMFYTQTHPEKREVEGLALMRATRLRVDAADLRTTLLGVGGISVGNCGEVLASGGDGVAVIRGLSDAASPRDTAALILVNLEKTGC